MYFYNINPKDNQDVKGFLQILVSSLGLPTHKTDFTYDPNLLKQVNTKEKKIISNKKKKVILNQMTYDTVIIKFTNLNDKFLVICSRKRKRCKIFDWE